jgi:hypothetical protein
MMEGREAGMEKVAEVEEENWVKNGGLEIKTVRRPR